MYCNQEQYILFIHLTTILECLLCSRHYAKEIALNKQWFYIADILAEESNKNGNYINNNIDNNNNNNKL